MRQIIIFFWILISLACCQKQVEFDEQQEIASAGIALEQIEPNAIGGDSTEPDLVLGLFYGPNTEDFNYDGMQTFMPQVVRNVVVTPKLNKVYGWSIGDTIDVIRAACNVRNIAPRTYSVKRDRFDSTNFMFNELTDAESYVDETGHTSFILHNFLKSGTWINGVKQFPSQYKISFEPSATEKLPLVDSISHNGNNYAADVGYDYPIFPIQAQFGDEYFNLFRIPRGFTGTITLNPTVNPEYAEDKRVSHESNYANNTTVISFVVGSNSVIFSPEPPFPLWPPDHVTASPPVIGKGKNKATSFKISWQSTNDWFKITRAIQYNNGNWTSDIELGEIYGNLFYIDDSPEISGGNIKKIIYAVYSLAEGIGQSAGQTVIITK